MEQDFGFERLVTQILDSNFAVSAPLIITQGLPSLNACRSQEEILALNGRLVTFDCLVQDMYDEEYFV